MADSIRMLCFVVCVSCIGSRNVFQRLSFNTFKQRKVNGGEKLGELAIAGSELPSEEMRNNRIL